MFSVHEPLRQQTVLSCEIHCADACIAAPKRAKLLRHHVSVRAHGVFFFSDNVQYIHKPLARTKKPYKPSKEKRNIKSYWFREFPWLVFDESKNLFFCSYCTAVKCDNIFTRGRPAIKPRKDSMVKHELTNPHKTAMSRLKIIPDVSKERYCSTCVYRKYLNFSSFAQ